MKTTTTKSSNSNDKLHVKYTLIFSSALCSQHSQLYFSSDT